MTWLQLAMQKETVVRSLNVAAVVGTVLCLINNGDFLLAGEFHNINWFKVALTYCVPYSVATYSSVAAQISDDQSQCD